MKLSVLLLLSTFLGTNTLFPMEKTSTKTWAQIEALYQAAEKDDELSSDDEDFTLLQTKIEKEEARKKRSQANKVRWAEQRKKAIQKNGDYYETYTVTSHWNGTCQLTPSNNSHDSTAI